MKTTILLLTILLSFAEATSFAQGAIVTLGDIPANMTAEHTIATAYTTSDQIIKIGKLAVHRPDCEVVSYTFSILVRGEVRGPITVKGAQLTDEVIEWVKETKGPGVQVFFDEIRVKQDGIIRHCAPLSFKYDQ